MYGRTPENLGYLQTTQNSAQAQMGAMGDHLLQEIGWTTAAMTILHLSYTALKRHVERRIAGQIGLMAPEDADQ